MLYNCDEKLGINVIDGIGRTLISLRCIQFFRVISFQFNIALGFGIILRDVNWPSHSKIRGLYKDVNWANPLKIGLI